MQRRVQLHIITRENCFALCDMKPENNVMQKHASNTHFNVDYFDLGFIYFLCCEN